MSAWLNGLLEGIEAYSREPVPCGVCGELLVRPDGLDEAMPVFCRLCFRQNRIEKRLDEIARLLASLLEK